MENNIKRGLITGKSYVVANAIIRANKIDDRLIIDQRDVDNLEFMVVNKLNYMGINAKFIDDLRDDTFNNEVVCLTETDEKLFMLLPGVNVEEFEKSYREGMSYKELSDVFASLDNDPNLLRNPDDVEELKHKQELLKELFPVEKTKPVSEKPKYYAKVSEK